MSQSLQLPPLSLYVHIPWCVRKCPYCDFNSHAREPATIPEQAYIDALLQDLELDQEWAQGRSIGTVFFGGGTPSLLSGAGLGRLLEGVHRRVPLDAQAEITLEANPGTLEQGKFKAFREAGVNRLSIGIQSFDPEHLQRLGRIHSREEAQRAVASAFEAGIDNVNLDLMFALPQQTVEQALTDLCEAVRLAPTHLSWYQLTLEPNTAFYSEPPRLPDDDTAWAIQSQGQAYLAQQGYRQYEVSAYARDHRRCRHNVNYWRFGDYLAIGAGAHGKITRVAENEVLRYQKTRLPEDYLAAARRLATAEHPNPFTSRCQPVAAGERPFEFLMNALRLNDGIAWNDYEAFTGCSRQDLLATLAPLQQQGLLWWDNHRLATTDQGALYLNSVLEALL